MADPTPRTARPLRRARGALRDCCSPPRSPSAPPRAARRAPAADTAADHDCGTARVGAHGRARPQRGAARQRRPRARRARAARRPGRRGTARARCRPTWSWCSTARARWRASRSRPRIAALRELVAGLARRRSLRAGELCLGCARSTIPLEAASGARARALEPADRRDRRRTAARTCRAGSTSATRVLAEAGPRRQRRRA